MYRCVIFDLDGTLLNTLCDLAAAVNHSLLVHSLPARTQDEVRRFIGDGVAKLIERAVPTGTPKDVTAAVLSDFKIYYAEHCEDMTSPYPDILPLLSELKGHGILTGIVSNKFDAAVKALSAHYFHDLIDVAVGERETEGIRKKPAPDTLWMAMKELGVSPTETLYVGDADTDILTASAAGVDCVSVTWGFRDRDFLVDHGASVLIDTPDALLSLIWKG